MSICRKNLDTSYWYYLKLLKNWMTITEHKKNVQE